METVRQNKIAYQWDTAILNNAAQQKQLHLSLSKPLHGLSTESLIISFDYKWGLDVAQRFKIEVVSRHESYILYSSDKETVIEN